MFKNNPTNALSQKFTNHPYWCFTAVTT